MGRKNAFKLDVVSVRLVQDTPLYAEVEIHSPEDAIALVGEAIVDMDREIVCVINLRSDGKPINCNFASVGAVNYSMAHPRELLKTSVLSNAATMLLVHNHPSGRLIPSRDDVMMTDRMRKIGELIGIPLLDHIIVGGRNKKYYSFKEKGMVESAGLNLATEPSQIHWGDTRLIAERSGKAR